MSVAGYIAALPSDRAGVIDSVRNLVNEHLPLGYVETMRWGMISWEVPLDRFGDTYNREPLNYIGLAAQKAKNSLYLMSCYVSEQERADFEAAYLASGKKPDMGKSCIRFRSLDDLPIPLVITMIRRYPVAEFIEAYRRSRTPSDRG